LILSVIAVGTPAQPEAKADLSVAAKPGEWRYLNSDPLSTRYSALDQINRDNFKDLRSPGDGNLRSDLLCRHWEEPRRAKETRSSQSIEVDRPHHGPRRFVHGRWRSTRVAAIDARQVGWWMWMGMDEGGRDRKAPRRNAGRGVA
jgi:hypothetical protein